MSSAKPCGTFSISRHARVRVDQTHQVPVVHLASLKVAYVQLPPQVVGLNKQYYAKMQNRGNLTHGEFVPKKDKIIIGSPASLSKNHKIIIPRLW